MRKLLAMVMTLFVFFTMIGTLPIMVSAAEWYTDWTREGTIILNGDAATLKAANGEQSYIVYDNVSNVGERFDISFTLQMNSYSDYANIQIWSGNYRAYFNPRVDRIFLRHPMVL